MEYLIVIINEVNLKVRFFVNLDRDVASYLHGIFFTFFLLFYPYK